MNIDFVNIDVSMTLFEWYEIQQKRARSIKRTPPRWFSPACVRRGTRVPFKSKQETRKEQGRALSKTGSAPPFHPNDKNYMVFVFDPCLSSGKIDRPLNVIREAAVKFASKENQKSDLTFWFLLAETSLP